MNVVSASAADAAFFGLDVDPGGLRASIVLTPRLMSADGSFYGGTGLALACIMLEQVTGRSTRWCTAQFVGGAASGDRLDVTAEVVAQGRRTSQTRVVARVRGREVFSALGATATADNRVNDSFARKPTVMPVEKCEQVTWEFGRHHSDSHFGIKEIRQARVLAPGDGAAVPRIALWLRMLPQRSWTPALLAFVADVASIAIHRVLATPHSGGVSLDNTLRVGPSAPTEWLLLALHPEAVADGFAHGSVHLWAPNGTLVGIATQTFALGRAHAAT